MIDLQAIYDLLSESFGASNDFFHWGDNTIVQGSLENLPMPAFFKGITKGLYYALFDITCGHPGVVTDGLYSTVYDYSIILCRKGKVGDVTKIRSGMASKFLAGFASLLDSRSLLYSVDNVFPRANEIEISYDSITVHITGTITRFEE